MKNKIKIDNIIGAFEAKTHLSELLQRVQRGQSITITNRGKPVAQLIPFENKTNKLTRMEVIDEFIKIKKTIKGKVNIREYKSEGRKY